MPGHQPSRSGRRLRGLLSRRPPAPRANRTSTGRRTLLRVAVAGAVASAVVIVSAPAHAASTNSIVYHADGAVAGEVWFNSGFSSEHVGAPQFGPNTFTVRDRFCGDGWGVGVEWTVGGHTDTWRSAGDCGPEEVTFEAGPNQATAAELSWRSFRWDVNGISDTTYELARDDWMGSDNGCDSVWMGRVATYGFDVEAVGHTFEVSMWPTLTARAAGRNLVPELWEAVQACSPLPKALTETQRSSLYKQLYCHAVFGVDKRLGGETWDLEADREDISWAKVMLGWKRCNW
ncbi:DUF2599 domain-containing protein [Parafrankia sp. FMc2]|uniref:DUF2599 domain-containing protein n=1 Tax=Parafrankia sp. FMc2 TaxID=3233196 RepID=UPI0034D79AC9